MPSKPYATRRCTATCVVEIPGPVESLDEAREAVEAKFPGSGIYLVETMGTERVFAFIQVSAIVGVLDRNEAKASVINIAKQVVPSLEGEYWTARVPK